MARKDFTFTSKLLIALLTAGDLASYVVGDKYEILKIWKGKPSYFRNVLSSLVKRGVITVEDKNNRRFIKLTRKGQLEALFAKARLPSVPHRWDGKWRILFFDIPEESKHVRKQLRELLKKSGFVMLQASVYINPYPLSQDAIIYLKQSKLINYIRIARVDQLDSDRSLIKKFHLTYPLA